MRVKILSPRVTFGEVGQTVEVPDGVNVDALVAASLCLARPFRPFPRFHDHARLPRPEPARR